MKDFPSLPDGWIWTTIGEITLPVEKVFPRSNPTESFIYIDISSIDNKDHKIVEPKIYIGSEAPSRARQLVRKNDVLFSTVRTYLENVALVPESFDEQIASTGFSVLRASRAVHPKFLFYYTLTKIFLEPLNKVQRGTSYPAVRDSDVRIQPFPLPPLLEQKRIVAKIEELFTQLEAGTAALRRVQAGLKRYKASVLKAAVEGRLTARETNFGENGLQPSWRWAKVSEIAEVRLGRQRSPSRSIGSNMKKYMRAANVTWHGIDLSDVKEMDFTPREQGTYRLKFGDILLSEASGSISEVGKPAIWKDQLEEVYFQNTLIRVRLVEDLPEYFYYHFLYDAIAERFRKIAKGVGIHHLGAENFSNWIVSLPPLAEQSYIVAEIDRRLSVIAEVDSAVEAGLRRANRLRQAILKRAFEGRLA